LKKIGSTGTQSALDTYRLIIMSEDGTYAVHDLQFKDTKSIAKFSGLLQELRPLTQSKE